MGFAHHKRTCWGHPHHIKPISRVAFIVPFHLKVSVPHDGDGENTYFGQVVFFYGFGSGPQLKPMFHLCPRTIIRTCPILPQLHMTFGLLKLYNLLENFMSNYTGWTHTNHTSLLFHVKSVFCSYYATAIWPLGHNCKKRLKNILHQMFWWIFTPGTTIYQLKWRNVYRSLTGRECFGECPGTGT